MNPNEYWLGELVSYLLEQARYEREAVTMEAIDREKLEEYFGCPFGDIDIEKIALSEWERLKQCLPIRLTHTPTRDRFCVYNG